MNSGGVPAVSSELENNRCRLSSCQGSSSTACTACTRAHVYAYVFVYSSLTLEQRKHDFKNWVQNCMFMIYIRDLLVYRNKGSYFLLAV